MKIHDYVREGNIEGVKAELANGVALDAIEEETGKTPYECVFENMDVDMMVFLVEQGALPTYTAPVEKEKTELEIAIVAGNLDKTRQLLDAGADVNYVNEEGDDVLKFAMLSPQPLEMVRLLLEKGAPPTNRYNFGNEQALSRASWMGRFDIVKLILDAGGAPDILQWTELMSALVFGDLNDVRKCLAEGANLTARDWWKRTPFLLSLHVGDIAKTRLLLDSGADRNAQGQIGQTPLMYPCETGNTAMLAWLIETGFDIEAKNVLDETALAFAAEQGSAPCVKLLLEAGAKTRTDKEKYSWPIAKASTREVINLLLEAGEELKDIDDEVRAMLLGLGYEGQVETTIEAYLESKTPRFGTTNPEKMEIPFWDAMVRSGAIAHNPRTQFNDVDYRVGGGPVWCFHRFGKSITELPDGRFIEIAGEHEDAYDPDFCIYNDVFVHHGDGQFDIYGYPREVFQPTDFHSATLVGQHIYIIGSIGYPEDRREGQTPVYRLNTETFTIEAVKTSGKNPGWISSHKAVYREGEGIEISEGKVWKHNKLSKNKSRFVLDLETMKWRKLAS